jgi:hypothetical protein
MVIFLKIIFIGCSFFRMKELSRFASENLYWRSDFLTLSKFLNFSKKKIKLVLAITPHLVFLGQIFNDTSCIYARKHIFQNLDSNSLISRAVFLCLWDFENEICRSRRLDAMDIIPENKNSFALIIVFVFFGVWRVNNKTKEYEMSNDILRTLLMIFFISLTCSEIYSVQ